jgi:thiopeptide-type bacteriocin biosynthesis protein
MPAHHLTDAPSSVDATRWFHASVRFADWPSSERAMARLIGPRLDALTVTAATGQWWFLRKHPCWRIRVAGIDPAQVAGLLGQLADDGVIDGWHQEIYEPEEHAFGGPAGMAVAHSLFCADSQGVLGYARLDSPPLGRRELSLLLTGALMGSAGLDWFERGDVFARVARMRPAPPRDSTDKLTQLTGQLHALAAVPVAEVITGSGMAQPGAQWLDAFSGAGRRLSESARHGELDRGLRAVLTHIVIFHWNRLGLTATTQGILATAARDAYLPRD